MENAPSIDLPLNTTIFHGYVISNYPYWVYILDSWCISYLKLNVFMPTWAQDEVDSRTISSSLDTQLGPG
jgi:hypothetical protein